MTTATWTATEFLTFRKEALLDDMKQATKDIVGRLGYMAQTEEGLAEHYDDPTQDLHGSIASVRQDTQVLTQLLREHEIATEKYRTLVDALDAVEKL